MMNTRHVQNKTFGDIEKAFGEARKTPYFDALPRKSHSFIVTSDQNATIKDLKGLTRRSEKVTKPRFFSMNSIMQPSPVSIKN